MSWSTAGQVENEESVHQFNLLSQEQHTGMGMSMDCVFDVIFHPSTQVQNTLYQGILVSPQFDAFIKTVASPLPDLQQQLNRSPAWYMPLQVMDYGDNHGLELAPPNMRQWRLISGMDVYILFPYQETEMIAIDDQRGIFIRAIYGGMYCENQGQMMWCPAGYIANFILDYNSLDSNFSMQMETYRQKQNHWLMMKRARRVDRNFPSPFLEQAVVRCPQYMKTVQHIPYLNENVPEWQGCLHLTANRVLYCPVGVRHDLPAHAPRLRPYIWYTMPRGFIRPAYESEATQRWRKIGVQGDFLCLVDFHVEDPENWGADIKEAMFARKFLFQQENTTHYVELPPGYIVITHETPQAVAGNPQPPPNHQAGGIAGGLQFFGPYVSGPPITGAYTTGSQNTGPPGSLGPSSS